MAAKGAKKISRKKKNPLSSDWSGGKSQKTGKAKKAHQGDRTTRDFGAEMRSISNLRSI